MIIISPERLHRLAIRATPLCWMLLAGTQGLGMLRILGVNVGNTTSDPTAGSPVERMLFGGLLLLGLYLLSQRTRILGPLFRANIPLVMLFCYIGLSISWSPMPVVSTKRFIKMVGALIMALLIVSEHDPFAALVSLLKRYLWIVLIGSSITILFIPAIGRVVHQDGTIANAGICFGKNGLGQCALAAILLSAVPLLCRGRRALLFENMAMLAMAVATLVLSHSVTSLAVCVTVVAVLFFVRNAFVRRVARVGTATFFIIAFAITTVLFLESILGSGSISGPVIQSIGRDSTLTGRTDIWAKVWQLASERPIFGYGTGCFWVGEIGVSKPIIETYFWVPNQGHNGYLDVIAELGFVGLGLVLAVALHGLFSAFRMLPTHFQYAMLRIALLFSVLLLNITESSLCRITHRVWMFMLLAVAAPPVLSRLHTPTHPDMDRESPA